MELGDGLAAGDIARVDVGVAGADAAGELKAFVGLLPGAEEELEVRIDLLEKRLEITLHTGLRAVDGFEHADGWEEDGFGAGLTALSQTEAKGRRDDHQTVDGRRDGSEHGSIEQKLRSSRKP